MFKLPSVGMKRESRWSDSEAASYVERLGARWGENLALRVYTSRLIGGDPSLVLHGGGNTSLKGKVKTLLGDEVEALFIKGSGWDLDSIEPPDAQIPALTEDIDVCVPERSGEPPF